MPDLDLRAIQDHAVTRHPWSKMKTTNLFIRKSVLKAGSAILAYRQEIPLRRDTVMVFADDAPQFNWSHPCRYLLYDARTNEAYDEVPAQFPPYMTQVPNDFEPFHMPVRLDVPDIHWPIWQLPRWPVRFPKGQRYAVLYSGASNNRHTNDLEFLYRVLRHHYGFADANIYCLNYDGTLNYSGGPHPVGNWPGDNTPYQMPVKGAGTKAALDAVLDEIRAKVKPDDVLLIHTNNHGGWNGPGQAYLCTYSGPSYMAADFGAKLAQFPPFYCLMAMYEQCHSGGFNAVTVANSKATYTTVSSACLESNNSIGGASFDPFARDWISAMMGTTPSGGALAFNPDSNGNGRVSAHEAHNYADAVHDPYDTPIYSENSVTAGETNLGQRYVWWWLQKSLDLRRMLEPHLVKLPSAQFYERWDRIAPQLQEYEDALEKAHAQEAQLDPKLKQVIEQAFR
jgi:hypothetical protein